MNLVTQELRERLPQLYATREEPDPIAQVRFVSERPTQAEWYAVEYDGKNMFYGLIACSETRVPSLVYFSLGEPIWWADLGSISVCEWKYRPHVVDVLRYDADFEPKPITRIFPSIVLSYQSRLPSPADGFHRKESHR